MLYGWEVIKGQFWLEIRNSLLPLITSSENNTASVWTERFTSYYPLTYIYIFQVSMGVAQGPSAQEQFTVFLVSPLRCIPWLKCVYLCYLTTCYFKLYFHRCWCHHDFRIIFSMGVCRSCHVPSLTMASVHPPSSHAQLLWKQNISI